MLLFIEDELSKIADSGRFNTSHVTLYRYIRGIIIVILWFQYISCYSLSIPEDVQDKIKKLFQYISCYSLSQNSCRTEDSLMSFNTSHITLYRSLFRTSSDSSIVSIHLMLLFIGFRTETVISCIWVSIHLMLLFIIPALPGPERTVASFNTSLFIILARFIP